MMTVTYLSPLRVCRQQCSSTPITSTPSRRPGWLISTVVPTSVTAVFAVPQLIIKDPRDTADWRMIENDLTQGPPVRCPDQLRSGTRHRHQRVPPQAAATSASETGHHDVQPGRFAAQRQVGEPTLYLVVDPAGGTASRAPVINACQRANQDRLVGPDLLGLDPQTQDIDLAGVDRSGTVTGGRTGNVEVASEMSLVVAGWDVEHPHPPTRKALNTHFPADPHPQLGRATKRIVPIAGLHAACRQIRVAAPKQRP